MCSGNLRKSSLKLDLSFSINADVLRQQIGCLIRINESINTSELLLCLLRETETAFLKSFSQSGPETPSVCAKAKPFKVGRENKITSAVVLQR